MSHKPYKEVDGTVFCSVCGKVLTDEEYEQMFGIPDGGVILLPVDDLGEITKNDFEKEEDDD